jgi:hypothetical protein
MKKNLGYESYKIYRALKFHFNTKDYDFKRYHANTNRSVESWNECNFREIFALYSRKLSITKLKDLFLSNFIENPKYFPNNYELELDIYLEWVGRINSIKYNFEKDVKRVKKFLDLNNLSFKDIIISRDGKLPIIILLAFKKGITFESFIILDYIFNILDRCTFLSSDTKLLYDKRLLLLKKYKVFFNIINIKEYKIIVKNVFN